MGDLELVGDKPLTAKESLRMSLENVAPLINPKTDFASIKGKIEPTRDLILKLIDPFLLSFDTDLVKEETVDGVRYYTMKARVVGPDGRTVTGWGKCGTDDVGDGERADHDALTKAETRALKRAIEAKAGYGMVNQLILKFFGEYEQPKERDVTPSDDKRKALVDRLVALGDAISAEEKEIIRKTLRTLSTGELGPYVEKWEKKVGKPSAGVPDEKVPF